MEGLIFPKKRKKEDGALVKDGRAGELLIRRGGYGHRRDSPLGEAGIENDDNRTP